MECVPIDTLLVECEPRALEHKTRIGSRVRKLCSSYPRCSTSEPMYGTDDRLVNNYAISRLLRERQVWSPKIECTAVACPELSYQLTKHEITTHICDGRLSVSAYGHRCCPISILMQCHWYTLNARLIPGARSTAMYSNVLFLHTDQEHVKVSTRRYQPITISYKHTTRTTVRRSSSRECWRNPRPVHVRHHARRGRRSHPPRTATGTPGPAYAYSRFQFSGRDARHAVVDGAGNRRSRCAGLESNTVDVPCHQGTAWQH